MGATIQGHFVIIWTSHNVGNGLYDARKGAGVKEDDPVCCANKTVPARKKDHKAKITCSRTRRQNETPEGKAALTVVLVFPDWSGAVCSHNRWRDVRITGGSVDRIHQTEISWPPTPHLRTMNGLKMPETAPTNRTRFRPGPGSRTGSAAELKTVSVDRTKNAALEQAQSNKNCLPELHHSSVQQA